MNQPYSWYKTQQMPIAAKDQKKWYYENQPWIWFGGILFTLLALNNLYIADARSNDWWAYLLLVVLYLLAWMLYRKFAYAKALFLNYLFPICLAVLVLLCGTIGFYFMPNATNWPNAFFSAANLITLNSSEFHDLGGPPNALLKLARFLGGFLAAYAFMVAFSLAVGKENLSRLNFWWHRFARRSRIGRFLGLETEFLVVIGDGIMAEDLAYDLSEHWQRFVFLDTSEGDYLSQTFQDTRCWYFRGKAYSKKDLGATYFWLAKEVYVLNQEDDLNFRAVNELSEIESTKKVSTKNRWHVHLSQQELRESVHSLLERRSAQINAFSIEQNTAERLLLQCPIDRFTSSIQTAQVVIVGAGRQAEELLQACLQMGHFSPGYHLRIDLFSKNHALKIPVLLDKSHYLSNFPNKKERDVIKYTFKSITVRAHDLPEREAELRHHSFNFYHLFTKEVAASLYVCLDDGMQNAQFLHSVLPRLSYLKDQKPRDIEVFSYFNYPDKNEQIFLNHRLCKLFPNLSIRCFGNMLDECSSFMISNNHDVVLAKRIAFIYHCIFGGVNEALGQEAENMHAVDNNLGELGEKVNLKDQKKKPISIQEYLDEKEKLLRHFFVNYELFVAKKGAYALENGKLIRKEEQEKRFPEDVFWEGMSQADRESNIHAANHVDIKQRLWESIRKSKTSISQEELLVLSEVEHRRWNAMQLLLGWQPYINTAEWEKFKNALRKQKYHNYLVTFDYLPEYEKSKDWVQVMGVIK